MAPATRRRFFWLLLAAVPLAGAAHASSFVTVAPPADTRSLVAPRGPAGSPSLAAIDSRIIGDARALVEGGGLHAISASVLAMRPLAPSSFVASTMVPAPVRRDGRARPPLVIRGGEAAQTGTAPAARAPRPSPAARHAPSSAPAPRAPEVPIARPR